MPTINKCAQVEFSTWISKQCTVCE